MGNKGEEFDRVEEGIGDWVSDGEKGILPQNKRRLSVNFSS